MEKHPTRIFIVKHKLVGFFGVLCCDFVLSFKLCFS